MTDVVDTIAADPQAAPPISASPTANLLGCLVNPDSHSQRNRAVEVLLGLDQAAARFLEASELLSHPQIGGWIDSLDDLLAQPNFPDGQTNLAWEMVAKLRGLAGSARSFDTYPASLYDDEQLRLARGNASQVQRLLATAALGSFSIAQQDRPVVAPPVGLALKTITAMVDQRTEMQHSLILAVLGIAHQRGHSTELQISNGLLRGEVIAYRHPGTRGTKDPSGIRVGNLLLDVPDYPGQRCDQSLERLRRRSGRLRPIIVAQPSDVGQLTAVIGEQFGALIR